MSAFDVALAVLHADPNLSTAAVFREGGAGAGRDLRVIRSRPDEVDTLGNVARVRGTDQVSIRIADLPNRPSNGDTITIGGETLTVSSAEADAEGLSWLVACRNRV